MNKKTDELQVELARQDELKNKKLMTNMWVLLCTTSIFYIGIIYLAIFALKEGPLLGTIVGVSTVIFVIVAFYALKLEVEAGYYKCNNCGHRFIPTYWAALWAPHFHTTRYLKCPECNNRSWAKKVMTKED
jgi:DNA-directed RNA polymerase subunit RPC12/RpoP